MKFITSSEKQTFVLAKKIVSKLKGGEVICLMGDLGAGKTAFTKGLAQALKVKNIVTSPTFVLMKVYKADHKNIKTLVHIDAYRLSNGQDLENIGALDYFGDKSCITVIEWAERIKDVWPKRVIKIEFKIFDCDKREIRMEI